MRREGAGGEEEGGRKRSAWGEGVREEKTNRRTGQAGRATDPEGLAGLAARADSNGRVGRRTLEGGSGGRWLKAGGRAAKRANGRAVTGGSGGRNLAGGSLKRDSCMNREEVSGESVIP